jgi:hypothetical protein
MVHRLLGVTSLAVATFCVALAAARPTQIPAQAPARPPAPVIPAFGTGTGAISGVVVDARTGRPIGGAIAGIAILVRNVVGPARRQTTDSRGRFVFTDLPASDGYILSARKGGYETEGAFGRGTTSTPRALSLAEGEWRADATIRLWRQAAINGTVIDEAGEPVAGATVMLLGRPLVAGQPQLAAGPATRTDDRGIYRFAGLPPGTYLVAVPSVQWSVPAAADVLTLTGQSPERIAQIETAGGTVAYRRDPSLVADPTYRLLTGSFPTPPPPGSDGRLRTYPTWYYPAARQPAQATAIDLALGDDRQGIDIQIQPVTTARIRGRVDAAPEVRANLTLRLVTDETESLGSGGEIATAMVTASGEFAFLGVPSGRYTIVAQPVVGALQLRSPTGAASMDQPPPHAPAQLGSGMFGSAIFAAPSGTFFDSRNTLSAPGWYGRTAVDVGNADVAGVVVALRRGITMRGRIINEGGAAPATGRGPSVLSIRLSPADGRVALGQHRGNVKPGDPEQGFVVEGLLPGEYVLEATSGNSALAKSIVWDGKDYTYRPFDTASGADITGVVVTMTNQACEINGTALDARGAPVANGAVIYFPVEREQWTKYGFQPTRLRSVPVSTGGVFTITRIPAGEYLVIAVSEAHASRWQDPEFLTRVAPLATKVSVQWGAAVTQALTLRDVK